MPSRSSFAQAGELAAKISDQTQKMYSEIAFANQDFTR
jgi:hypothetical protein